MLRDKKSGSGILIHDSKSLGPSIIGPLILGGRLDNARVFPTVGSASLHDFQAIISPRLTDNHKIRIEAFQPLVGVIRRGYSSGVRKEAVQQTSGKPGNIFSNMKLASRGLKPIPFLSMAWPMIHTGGDTMSLLE